MSAVLIRYVFGHCDNQIPLTYEICIAGDVSMVLALDAKLHIRYSGDFFRQRLALMPEPERWDECLSRLNDLYNKERLSKETFERIKCPVLVMSGDRDGYHSVDAVAQAAKDIEGSQLSIIPGCDHVVFFCNFPAVWTAIEPFLSGE